MSYPHLKAAMTEKNISIKDISESTGISQKNLAYKIDCGGFSIEEAEQIQKTFFQDMKMECLFRSEQ
ncbi:hypothetical protein [Qiania dongpingensis]|uniref:XRE family transcriptional regulator n=1 Tax=Qiania dongpingensis TaxID=2763669 RepID=A0A7G9G5G7_9FIRM|nr:hypothetical protein [Qiania dongpingensis]QNM06049.1 hypothetical protein H9Q78_02480 [Qiania dongpingensis]